MRNIYKAFAILFVVLMFASCQSKEDLTVVDKKDTKTEGNFKRTVFLYMIADSKLKSDGDLNIRTILSAAKDVDLYNNNIVMYYDAYRQDPYLLEIKKRKDNTLIIDTLNVYPERNSCSVAIMSEMMDKIVDDYPSDKYGLVLWGHGSSWLPANWFSDSRTIGASFDDQPDFVRQPMRIDTKCYGGDDGEWLEIEDLKAAIPDKVFDYMIFDVCYMAGVEVFYELRNKADHIIASSAEILGSGFPYQDVTKHLVDESPDLQKICRLFYDYYNNDTREIYRTATISLVKTSALGDMARVSRELLGQNNAALYAPIDNLQKFDRQYTPKVLYDMGDYMQSFLTESQYETFEDVLNEVVVYEIATDWVLKGQLPTPGATAGFKVNAHSGLTIYPYKNITRTINENYRQTDWYKAVYE